MSTRVMLAENKPWNEAKIEALLAVEGWMWMQPKIDGMRMHSDERRVPLSRSGKEFKQRHLRALLQERPSLAFIDGEVVAGHQYDPTSFRESMSGIRAEDGSPEFTFYGFDHILAAGARYADRLDEVKRVFEALGSAPLEGGEGYSAKLVVCPSKVVTSLDDIYEQEQHYLLNGWEGGILRAPWAPYKFGRSSYGDGGLIKLKRFEDAEAIVTGYEPWYTNNNEAYTDARGYTARSAHQENLEALDRLGCLHVELATDRSVKFKIGVFKGWGHGDRDRLWEIRDTLPGRILKFTHQGYGGGYDVPRTPVGLGFRDAADF